ncbi:MAG TPA: right-handed parallel beta-helix repeat-containing protein [Pyrinomonadaceae bacterium]|nr:right-handed parallel beta-helix repeat-containing protein [Pyrinomonadaceae bacterium]
MNKLRLTTRALIVVGFTLVFASLVQAQATRTWVSGVGDDVNPCSRTAPCKTYAGAISKTAKDGEISTLDPGGFGAVTITKSITINGTPGSGYGSILASLTQGVIVNITDAADVRKTVRLNWLDINGASNGTNGISFAAGLHLYVENTNIDGFTGDGIRVLNNPQAVNSLHLRNVNIRNCVTNGVNISNTGANATVLAFDGVKITRSTNGLTAGNGTRGQISNSFFASNSGSGITVSEGGSPTTFAVDTSSFTGNGVGISTAAGSEILIARCVITGNGNSLTTGGLVHTGVNNTIGLNGSNTAPNGTPFPQN